MPRIRTLSAALLLAGALTPSLAQAQRAVLRGQVLDGTTRQPVAAAVVESHHGRAITDRQGRFTLSVQQGEVVLEADAFGYELATSALKVTQAEQQLVIALDRDPVRLAAVTATVSRFEQRRRAYPHMVRTLDLRQVALSGSSDLSELLRTRMGVRFTSCGAPDFGCVYERGRPAQRTVYLDETRVPLAMLSAVRPDEVALLEVYGNGRQIRVYTRSFMEWAADYHYTPLPLIAAI
jgi:hypothetical protein